LLREIKYRVNEYPFKDITEKIISCAIEVRSNLGPGLLESVYGEAVGEEMLFILKVLEFNKFIV